MTKRYFLALGVCLLATSAGRAARDGGEWPIREQEAIEKTFNASAPSLRVSVDNVEGYVHVSGSGGSQVRLRAHKTIRAETLNDLAIAKQEVNLQIDENPGSTSFYYDAPWRCKGKHGSCDGGPRRFYTVVYDIDLEVPREALVALSTVNGGDIRVEKTAGNFDVRDVNGGIALSEISGSGNAITVNGPVSVQFVKNPTEACSFATINGQVDVFFHGSPSAVLLFKTFNGQIYSNFDVTSEPLTVAAESGRHDGKFVYRSNGFSRGRAGSGGPELKFDTLNGNIRLHQTSR